MCSWVLEGAEAALRVSDDSPGINPGVAVEAGAIECRWRRRNVWGSGEMQRDHTEHRLQRNLTNRRLTLMSERVGIEQD